MSYRRWISSISLFFTGVSVWKSSSPKRRSWRSDTLEIDMIVLCLFPVALVKLLLASLSTAAISIVTKSALHQATTNSHNSKTQLWSHTNFTTLLINWTRSYASNILGPWFINTATKIHKPYYLLDQLKTLSLVYLSLFTIITDSIIKLKAVEEEILWHL